MANSFVTFQPYHVIPRKFPRTRAELDKYSLILLSDIAADTLQLTSAVRAGEPDVDRCELLEAYVGVGGALGMIGGHTSFSDADSRVRYGHTALPEVLPVTLRPGDD